MQKLMHVIAHRFCHITRVCEMNVGSRLSALEKMYRSVPFFLLKVLQKLKYVHRYNIRGKMRGIFQKALKRRYEQ